MIRCLRNCIAPLLFSSLLCAGCGDDDGQKQGTGDARPEGFCDATIPCTDPARPFCDLGGIHPDSDGQPNTCIAKPTTVDCADAMDCTSEDKPQCTSAGDCVECLNFSHCNTTDPICSLSTHTCTSCRFGDEGDAVCGAIDPLQPYCAENGSCVECLDNSPCAIVSAPICDLTSFSCRGCLNSGECGGSACDTVSGVCEAGATL